MPPLQSIINKVHARPILEKKNQQFDLIQLKATNSLYELSENQQIIPVKQVKQKQKENVKEGVSPWNQSGKATFYKKMFKSNNERKAVTQCQDSALEQEIYLSSQAMKKNQRRLSKKIFQSQSNQNNDVQLVVCLKKKKSFTIQKNSFNQSINLKKILNKKITENWRTRIRPQEEKDYEPQIFRKRSQLLVNHRHPLLRLRRKRTNKNKVKNMSTEQYYSTNPLTRLLYQKYMQTVSMRDQGKKHKEIKLTTNVKTCPIYKF